LTERERCPVEVIISGAGSRFSRRVDRVLAKINHIEDHSGPEPDVGCRMCCPPTPNLIKVSRGVMQSVAALGCGDQRLL